MQFGALGCGLRLEIDAAIGEAGGGSGEMD
jgi:hypothetical protein